MRIKFILTNVQVKWYYNDYSNGGGDERRPYVNVASTTSRGRATEIRSSSAGLRVESISLVCPLLITALIRRVILVY